MTQKREKEETELKVPETISLRSSPSSTPIPVSPPPSQLSSFARPDPNLPTLDGSISSFVAGRTPERSDLVSCHKNKVGDMITNRPLKRPREGNRCSGPDCKRKLGLIGFRCRCGDMFCSEHRYSDRHGCSFDYKAAGREAIARENPVVKAAKIIKV